MKGSEQQQRDRLFIADSIEAKKTERGEERLAPEKKKKKVLSILTPERVPTNRGGQRGGRNVNKSNPKKKIMKQNNNKVIRSPINVLLYIQRRAAKTNQRIKTNF